jgi:hypothetical protein
MLISLLFAGCAALALSILLIRDFVYRAHGRAAPKWFVSPKQNKPGYGRAFSTVLTVFCFIRAREAAEDPLFFVLFVALGGIFLWFLCRAWLDYFRRRGTSSQAATEG